MEFKKKKKNQDLPQGNRHGSRYLSCPILVPAGSIGCGPAQASDYPRSILAPASRPGLCRAAELRNLQADSGRPDAGEAAVQ